MSQTPDLGLPPDLVLSGVTDAGVRMHHEQELLHRYFPDFELVRERSTQNYVARGVVSTELNLYAIRVRAPRNYPYAMPDIIPVGWKARGPHIYASGHLCVMQSDQWRNSYTLAFMVAKAAVWINKFEIFRTGGKWPGNEQVHGFRALLKWWNEV